MSEIVIIKFYADWCGPCKMLTPILKEVIEELKANNHEVRLLEVDVDKDKELVKAFEITSVPYTMIKLDGDVKFVFNGVLSKKEILKRLV